MDGRLTHWSILPLFALALPLIGCASPRSYYRPVENVYQPTPAAAERARYALAAEGGQSATATLMLVGLEAGQTDPAIGRDLLGVRITLDNPLSREVAIDAANFAVVDDENRPLQRVGPPDGQPDASQIRAKPGGRETVQWVYRLPDGLRLDAVAAVHVLFDAEVGDASERLGGKFIRSAGVQFFGEPAELDWYLRDMGESLGPYYGFMGPP